MHAAQGIVFVRHRPAKIHQQPIAEILRDVARVLLNHCGGGRLIRPHDLAQVFGVELLREPGGVRQVTEHHGQLPAFGLRGATGGFWDDGRLVLRGVCERGLWRCCRSGSWRSRLGDGWRRGGGKRQRGCRGVCGGRRTSHCPWGLHRRWSLSRPHQTRALRIASHLGEEQLLSYLLQARLVKTEDILQSTVCDTPLTLE